LTYKITQIFTRPNTDVAWYGEKYPSLPNMPSSRIAIDSKLSSDGLTMTVTSLWTSQADWEATWVNNDIQNWNTARATYNQNNGITLQFFKETI
jgi:hypothetical protein